MDTRTVTWPVCIQYFFASKVSGTGRWRPLIPPRIFGRSNRLTPFRIRWQPVHVILGNDSHLLLLLCKPQTKSMGIVPANAAYRMCGALIEARVIPTAHVLLQVITARK